MSLITQCPACATMFRVVPDQLRISDGWVRCGQCDEVFDANAQMVSGSGVVMEEDVAEGDSASDAFEAAAAATESDEWTQLVETETPLELKPDAEQLDPILLKSPGELSTFTASVVANGLGAERLRDLHQDEDPGRFSEQSTGVTEAPMLSDQRLSFVRRDAGAGGKSSAVRKYLGGVMVLFLTVMLGLQWAVRERDQIVAQHPGLEPHLGDLCSLLDCKLGPIRQIEALVIDSSAFLKVRNDMFRLNFVVKNNATTAVAVPAIELTLTDSQDQPLVRKVILSADFDATATRIAPAGELNASLPISVASLRPGERISGYRLVVFYP